MPEPKEIEKDVPSLLPLAPGGVYSNKWEERLKWKEPIEVDEVDYTPPYEVNPSNPRCYLDVRSGGYGLGRVVIELKADICPTTCDNFRQLCEYKCYTGSMFQVWPALAIQGGDFSKRDPLVWTPEDPECFDFDTLLPDVMPGGQSIFGAYFDDENFDLKHSGPGVLTMSNSGPNTNGSRFIITMQAQPKLDGTNVAFGQVIEGYEFIDVLTKVGKPHMDGSTFQRVTLDGCGVLPSPSTSTSAPTTSASATPSTSASARSAAAVAARPSRQSQLRLGSLKGSAPVRLVARRTRLGAAQQAPRHPHRQLATAANLAAKTARLAVSATAARTVYA
mmetsp:Transcript_30672/g.66971  ORF Transcript_30672/g.66971 Transcript_30672/m.66971 type:complete len:334 (-) Transcript_30672:454-1455(-)|eukprot:CAMPEP_0118933294 /NCGR_PEP_ID=MMETSP1169-20130426/11906_1 /TAXON_ID=36882 /ORGANISM="Pyramimonas obovata, Strain CCMP722" /LENGTH=333 /DNA_ID=CAMNT_0006876035 /DNA_START=76 /DNA_END=1077 /DNA_ORIENTATION=+